MPPTQLARPPAGLTSVAELASAWSRVAGPLSRAESSSGGGGGNAEGESLIIAALKLALACLHGAPPRPDGRAPLQRAVELAAVLADLSAAGIPLDHEAIAAGVVVEAVEFGALDMRSVTERCGHGVARLVHDVLRIRTAGTRVELYDDVASSAIREWCLSMHDVRANVLEVVSRWDDLQHMFRLHYADQQILALEALQLFAPLGHALGLGAISSRVEDLCFKVLFPASYTHTSEWLRDVVDIAEDSLFACQRQLLAALDDHPRFRQLAASCVIRARTKSLFSIMKKLLRLEDLSKGGRQKEEIFDILGMRAVVQPRTDLLPAEAEFQAREACYVVREVAERLWVQVPGRSKDYIARPKKNGYQSIHLTMQLPLPPGCSPPAAGGLGFGRSGGEAGWEERRAAAAVDAGPTSDSGIEASGGSDEAADYDEGDDEPCPAVSMPFIELQIRTQLMDELSEGGEASHSSYKGGLDSRQAQQLRDWTEQLRQRLAMRPGGASGQLLLPGPGGSGSGAAGAARGSGSRPQEDVSLAAEALFSNWDADGNGVISVEELRSQLRELGGGVAAEADAEALVSFLAEEEGQAAGGSRAAAGAGAGSASGEASGGAPPRQRGITLEEFSKFVRKVSLVGAIDLLDRQQAQDLSSEPVGATESSP